MTADASSTRPQPPQKQNRSGDAAVIGESFSTVEGQPEQFARMFYGMLFSYDPELRELFPANMQAQQQQFVRSLTHIVRHIDDRASLEEFLGQLAREHRKYGVRNKHYDLIAPALLAALKQCAGRNWSAQAEQAWSSACAEVVETMREAAAADESPAWWNGEVIEHRRVGSDLAVVRVRPDYPLQYEPGQYLSVEVPQRPRLWRYLSPANAPTADGVLEFHIKAVPAGWVSGAMVANTQLGDAWRLAAPAGDLRIDPEIGRDAVCIAGGTGIAPILANIDELSRRSDNPRVQLYYGARTAAALHGLDRLRELADDLPWLELTAIAESGAERVAGVRRGSLPELITEHGPWTEQDVFLAGSPEMLRASLATLHAAGTPQDRIHHDPLPPY